MNRKVHNRRNLKIIEEQCNLIARSFQVAMKLTRFLLIKNGNSNNGQTLDVELELNSMMIFIEDQFARQLKLMHSSRQGIKLRVVEE